MRGFGHCRERHNGEDRGQRFAFGRSHDHDFRDAMRQKFGRGGRLARMLEHGDLKMLVLHLIDERARHGYEIIKAVEELTGGAYAPSPGVVYPTLTLLEELGQVVGTAEGSRKSYAITDAGRQALAENGAAVQAILARMKTAQPNQPALPVIRAMENLKTALRLKLGAGTAPDVARKIADALDAAARAIGEL